MAAIARIPVAIKAVFGQVSALKATAAKPVAKINTTVQ
eukprot:CAMPEP_0198199024 /NCGR_PEP_ID=MMETSP1445-20131203/2366_1 /TAXON_ID=36898 /ORGANISM="Pyramimonas sp., Strain CCMP2087" /LENGTH=37 /DNA_ID= /DNA_START= /DNA_END= /DNA_ORIENTATION=